MQNHEHAVKYLEKFGTGKISQWLGTNTALVEEELTSQHLHSSLQSPVTPVSGLQCLLTDVGSWTYICGS